MFRGRSSETYLLGAPLVEAYPLVPLYRNQALGIALFSYNGGLFWGLNADWDALPDLHDLAADLVTEFEALRNAAEGATLKQKDGKQACSCDTSRSTVTTSATAWRVAGPPSC